MPAIRLAHRASLRATAMAATAGVAIIVATATPVDARVRHAAISATPSHTAAGQPASLHRCLRRHWVASWAASPSDAMAANDPSAHIVPQALAEQTLRMVVAPHLAGSKVRVHLSNRFGKSALTFGRVTISRTTKGAATRHPHVVTFDHHTTVTAPAGHDVVSDPVKLHVAPFHPISVSIYVPLATGTPTKHWNANATSYYSLPASGDLTADRSGADFSQVTASWLYLDGIDVMASAKTRAIVAFGDSITDGFVANDLTDQTTSPTILDKNGRYPDDLQRRVDAAHLPISIVNAGIGGNKLVTPGHGTQQGPAGVSRFRKDALRQAGVSGVLVLEGINDLGSPPALSTAPQVIAGLKDVIRQTHRANLPIWLAPILPASNAVIDGTITAPNSERYRETINTWIRHHHKADGIVHFAGALSNPTNRTQLLPRYSGPDHLHPNLAGYRKMARTVPLKLLASTASSC